MRERGGGGREGEREGGRGREIPQSMIRCIRVGLYECVCLTAFFVVWSLVLYVIIIIIIYFICNALFFQKNLRVPILYVYILTQICMLVL